MKFHWMFIGWSSTKFMLIYLNFNTGKRDRKGPIYVFPNTVNSETFVMFLLMRKMRPDEDWNN